MPKESVPLSFSHIGKLLPSLGAFLAAVSICVPMSARATEKKLQIAVTLAPQRYFVAALLEDAADVTVAIPANADHENFEPGIAALQRLARADAYVAIAHPRASFEAGWLDRLKDLRGKSRPLPVLSPSAGLAINPNDLHYWTSPRLMEGYVANLARLLRETFPEEASRIAKNERGFLSQIRNLDQQLSAELASSGGCTFFVAHGAWGYFAAEFGLRQLCLEEGGREPGLVGVTTAIRAAKAAKVRTLFREPRQSPDSVASVAAELHADIAVLDPLAEDWAANLRLVSAALQRACLPEASVPAPTGSTR